MFFARNKEGELESSLKKNFGLGKKIVSATIGALMMAGVSAYAADDDTVYDDDTTYEDHLVADVSFNSPNILESLATYDFEFKVENTTVVGAEPHWINALEMYMPSQEYLIDYGRIVSPEAIHDGVWNATELNDDGYPGIRWEYSGLTTSADYGDIRENDISLEGDIPEGSSLGGFGFQAMTDSAGTDGFPWAVWSADGLFYMGKTCIIESNCVADDDTHDDDILDDDTEIGYGDDDGGSGGGCGC